MQLETEIDAKDDTSSVSRTGVEKKLSAVKVRRRRINKRGCFDIGTIEEIMHLYPGIFRSRFRIAANTSHNKAKKDRILRKRAFKLLYKKLMSIYRKNDTFTAEASYKAVFKEKPPSIAFWIKFLGVLEQKRIIKRDLLIEKKSIWLAAALWTFLLMGLLIGGFLCLRSVKLLFA